MRDLSTVTRQPDRREPPPDGPEKVVLLLDVDGVVNAYGNPAHAEAVTKSVAAVPSGATQSGSPQPVSFLIRVGCPVLDAIHAWSDHPLVDLRWCTTWGQQAVTRLAPAFGLPELPFIPGSDFDGDWKLEVARATLQRSALIWCDDVWCRPQRVGDLGGSTPALFIAPDPNTGLSRRHLQDIEEFITERTERPPSHRMR